MIPVSVIVMTRNEESRLPRCLAALKDFAEVFVVDSASTDGTADVAHRFGAALVPFHWNGRYPKKKQWCLEHLPFSHDRVLYVDADEIVTPELCAEIAAADPACAGYFVPGAMLWQGRVLRYGLLNNKLALLNRHHWEFPVIDDLDLPGMGEVEGHYQPVLKSPGVIGQCRNGFIHDGAEDRAQWMARHRRYAQWEAGMNARDAWPRDPVSRRQRLKTLYRRLPCRAVVVFFYGYIVKRGFLDGRAGLDYARARAAYIKMIKAS